MWTHVSDIVLLQCMYLAYRLDFWQASHTNCIQLPSCDRSNNACGERPGLKMVPHTFRPDNSPPLLRDWGAPGYKLKCTLFILLTPLKSTEKGIVSCILADTLKSMFWHIHRRNRNISCAHLEMVQQFEPARLGLVAAEKASKLLWRSVYPCLYICLL